MTEATRTDRGSGRGAPKNNKPDNNDINAAQLAEITEFLDAELKTSGMTLHEYQQTFNTFQNGNPAVDDPSLWEHRVSIERSKAYQINSTDLFMLTLDPKLGVPSLKKLERGFNLLDKTERVRIHGS